MFIQTETTPNPATLKFLPGERVMGEGTANFPAREDAARSPLARLLFEIGGVEGVFLATDFITGTKAADKSWQSSQAHRAWRHHGSFHLGRRRH